MHYYIHPTLRTCSPIVILRKPNICNLCTFGSRVYAKKPGHRKAKLDHNTPTGIFVGYMTTIKNIYIIDHQSSKVKLCTHALFDEAHFIGNYHKAPMTVHTLQRLGYAIFDTEFKDGRFLPDTTLSIQRLISTAITPINRPIHWTQSTSL